MAKAKSDSRVDRALEILRSGRDPRSKCDLAVQVLEGETVEDARDRENAANAARRAAVEGADAGAVAGGE